MRVGVDGLLADQRAGRRGALQFGDRRVGLVLLRERLREPEACLRDGNSEPLALAKVRLPFAELPGADERHADAKARQRVRRKLFGNGGIRVERARPIALRKERVSAL